MSSQKLRDASDVLREAATAIDGNAGDRLAEQADRLGTLADRDRGPDHGTVARHQQKLKDITADEPTATDAVNEANDLLNAYRETIEGV
ncbi:hypothetical protein SAMN05192561_1373 [Halopenitus malekzadehii]|uniref:Uncharacterized protein n=1 Tax=Halopenitus malekzadehii TaxID=1267564 RepID=A0A1H6K6Z1_9EURY|nr:hypothetical protein [Halopenitus malekzadehii]SEH68774.1 hypothetical protein SAMN05192561_1373 [Halopenitus malekzadehii]